MASSSIAGATAAYPFCGLARTVNGFDLVDARGLSCRRALVVVARVERGVRGDWACSRAVHAVFELRCLLGAAEVRVLERSPVVPRRSGGIVRLRNWSFRVAGAELLAREGRRGWISLGRAPWCIPTDGPQEVLLALHLAPMTPHGGCFRAR
jgi:hypothetical protein